MYRKRVSGFWAWTHKAKISPMPSKKVVFFMKFFSIDEFFRKFNGFATADFSDSRPRKKG
jgi:hypothetical protein